MKKYCFLFLVCILAFQFQLSAEVSLPANFVDGGDPLNNKATQIDIILNYSKKSIEPETREYKLRLLTIMQAKIDFEKDQLEKTSKFIKVIETPEGEVEIPMSLDGVIEYYLDQQVKSGNITYTYNLSEIERALKVALPYVGGDGGIIDYLAENRNSVGNPPLSYSPELNFGGSYGKLSLYLESLPGLAGELARNDFKRLIKYDLHENLKLTEEFAEFEKKMHAAQEGTLLVDIVSEFKKQNDFRIKAQQEFEKQKQSDEKKLIEKKNKEYRENEIRAGFQIAETVAQLTGDPQLIRQVSGASKLADVYLKLDSKEFPKDSLMAFNLYVTGASVLINMFASTGPSESEMIMKQLQEILDLLIETRREMHMRFDFVDQKLNHIIYKIDTEFLNLRQSTDRIEANLAKLQAEIENQRQEMQSLTLALYERIAKDNIRSCLPMYSGPNPALTSSEYFACLNSVENNLYRNSLFGADPIAEPKRNLETIPIESFEFPYVWFMPSLVKYLRNDYGVSLDSESEMLNPYLWNRHVESLLAIWKAYPQFSVGYKDVPIKNAIAAGEKIQSVYPKLALVETSNGVLKVNIDLFKAILKRYKDQVKTALLFIDSKAREVHTLHINPGADKISDKEISALPLRKSKIKACPSSNDFGIDSIMQLTGLEYTPKNWPPLKNLRNVPPPELPMWSSAFAAIPKIFLAHEKRFPGSIEICLHKYRLTWKDQVNENTAKVAFTLRLQMNGGVVAEADVSTKVSQPTGLAVLKAIRADRNKMRINNQYYYYWDAVVLDRLYSVFWSNPAKSSGLSEDNIIKRNFTELTNWNLKVPLNEMRDDVFKKIIVDAEYTPYRKQIDETRNMLRILFQIGLSPSAPGRDEVQRLLLDSEETSSLYIRPSERILKQALTGEFTEEQIVNQVYATTGVILGHLQKMNASSVDLKPSNESIEKSIHQLKLLLPMELSTSTQ